MSDKINSPAITGPTRPTARIRVRCPKCGEVIETSTAVGGDTMVYCLACRRWCRELDEPAAATPPPPVVRKGIRCH